MIKLENTEVIGWEHAIRDIPSRSYRRTKNGRYEAYCSDHSHSIFLGTYDTPEYIRDHRYDDRKEVADHIGRNPETVRKYMYKYRRECNND